MTIFDLVLLLILFGFIWFDFWLGLIYAVGSLMGVVVASVLSSHWYEFVAAKLSFIFGTHTDLGKIICFIVLFIVIWRLVVFVFGLINKIFNIFTFIPFLKSINRLAGAALGFLEGALILGLVLFFLSNFPIGWLVDLINQSAVAQFLIKIAKILWPLLPVGLKKMQDIQQQIPTHL